jgi:hypothetical protein
MTTDRDRRPHDMAFSGHNQRLLLLSLREPAG